MNFKEPVSTFAYNLISLHYDIMWYIIINLTLVYWSLYKIIKEYSWSKFNKQEIILLILNFTFFLILVISGLKKKYTLMKILNNYLDFYKNNKQSILLFKFYELIILVIKKLDDTISNTKFKK